MVGCGSYVPIAFEVARIRLLAGLGNLILGKKTNAVRADVSVNVTEFYVNDLVGSRSVVPCTVYNLKRNLDLIFVGDVVRIFAALSTTVFVSCVVKA